MNKIEVKAKEYAEQLVSDIELAYIEGYKKGVEDAVLASRQVTGEDIDGIIYAELGFYD